MVRFGTSTDILQHYTSQPQYNNYIYACRKRTGELTAVTKPGYAGCLTRNAISTTEKQLSYISRDELALNESIKIETRAHASQDSGERLISAIVQGMLWRSFQRISKLCMFKLSMSILTLHFIGKKMFCNLPNNA